MEPQGFAKYSLRITLMFANMSSLSSGMTKKKDVYDMLTYAICSNEITKTTQYKVKATVLKLLFLQSF